MKVLRICIILWGLTFVTVNLFEGDLLGILAWTAWTPAGVYWTATKSAPTRRLRLEYSIAFLALLALAGALFIAVNLRDHTPVLVVMWGAIGLWSMWSLFGVMEDYENELKRLRATRKEERTQ